MAEEKNTKEIKQVSQEKVADILERGVIITMANDIRQLKEKGVLDGEESRAVFRVKQAQKVKSAAFVETRKNIEEQRIVQEIRKRARQEQEKRILQARHRIKQEQEKRVNIEKQRQEMIANQERKRQEQEAQERMRIIQEERVKDQKALKARQIAKIEHQKQQEREKQEQEEIKRKKAIKDKLHSAQELQKEKIKLVEDLSNIDIQQKPFLAKQQKLEKQKNRLLAKLDVLNQKEYDIQDKKQKAEQEERNAANPRELRNAEKNRWVIEKTRRTIEKKRWDLETKIKNKDETIQEVLGIVKIFKQKQARFLARQKQIIWDLKKIELIKEKAFLDSKQEGLALQERRLDQEEKSFFGKLSETDEKIKQITEKEKQIEFKVKEIEKEEQAIENRDQAKAQEKVRWQVEAQRREIEKTRWALENARHEILRIFQQSKNSKLDITEKIEETEERAEEIAILLEYGPVQGSKMLAQRKKENIIEVVKKVEAPLAQEKEIAREKIPGDREGQKQEQAKAIAQKQEQIIEERAQEEEKRKLIEIRKRAQQAKVQKMREQPKGPVSKEIILRKLTQISPQEETTRKKFLARVEGKENVDFVAEKRSQNRSEVIFRPVVKQPPALEKLLIRLTLLIVVLAILIVGSLWIYNTLKFPENNIPQEVIVDEPFPLISDLPLIPIDTGTDATSADVMIDIIIPEQEVDLIGAAGLMEVSFSTINRIPDLFKIILENQEYDNSFKQIIFRHSVTKELVSLKQFLEPFKVSIPLALSEVLENKQATIFLYNTLETSYFGFIVEIDSGMSERVENGMLNWESNISSDLRELSLALVNQNLVYQDSFKSAINQGKPFRYLDSSLPNFGICYSVTNGYLTFSFSCEAVVEVLKLIE